MHLQSFINFAQNDWVKLFLIIDFAYNNTKNASISYTPFELNCGYYPHMFFQENIDFFSLLMISNK